MIEQLGRNRTGARATLAVAVTIVTPQPARARTSDDKAPQPSREVLAAGT